MVGAADDISSAAVKVKSSRERKSHRRAKTDDDIVMVDAGGPSEDVEVPSVKRGDPTAKKGGLGGMFGGLLAKARPDVKRGNTIHTEDEGRGLRREERKVRRSVRAQSDVEGFDPENPTMTGGATEEDQEARRAARRARRAEREAAERAAEETRMAKEDERRERRRRAEDEAEARRQEEKESRRAARREKQAQEEAEQQAAEAKEAERAMRRRLRKAEREIATPAGGGEPTGDEGRPKISERRRSHMASAKGAGEDEERRLRRDERRAQRATGERRSSRRESAPVVDDYFDPRNGSKPHYEPESAFIAADGLVYKDTKRKKPGWPHSGTSSWVKENADAPPPPDDAPNGDIAAVDETEADENARRALRKTRRRSKYDDVTGEDTEERRRRRASRRAEREAIRSSEGSQGDGYGRRSAYRDSGYGDQPLSRAPSTQGRGSWWKKIAGV